MPHLGELIFYAVFFNCLCTGATLACGTGACATVVAAVLEGRAGRVCFLFDCSNMKTVDFSLKILS